MAAPKRAWIFSDIHLGPEGPQAIFRDGAALGAALRSIAEGDATPTELILAGDVFDFLQCNGYAGFDIDAAPARLDTILASAQSRLVIAGLTELAERPWCEVTVLAGNHDPELLLPAVRERFEAAIQRRGTVRWADDEHPLLQGDARRPALTGRALGHDGTVWVAHGDRWDGANAIDRPSVARAAREGAFVKLPAGSHLVFEVLAKITPTRPWVSLLKPEIEAVLPLLLYLDPLTTAGFLRTHYGLGARLIAGKIAAAMNTRPHLGAAPGATTEPTTPLAQALGALGASLAEEPSRDTIAAQLADYLEAGIAPTADGPTLAAHGGLRRWLARSWLAHVRESDEFLALDGDDDVIEGARGDLPANVALFVAGHTHGPRRRPELRYVNSGTWIPVGSIPSGDMASLIDRLDDGGPWPSESPRTWVRVDLDGDAPQAVLMSASPTGALTGVN